ncbi:MAG TPA: response regulator transcription factor [Thermomicrobiales bacterium]|jgi:NarL family two-component system response regulator LiaR
MAQGTEATRKGNQPLDLIEGSARVMLVDDHAVVRQGLRTFLDLQDDITVVGEAKDGVEALHVVQELEPDVVLMDLVMPRMDGIETVRRMKALRPHIQIIVLTSFGDDQKVFAAIRAGATGFLLKDVSPQDLAAAIHAARRGEASLAPGIATKLLQEIAIGSNPAAEEHTLTEREYAVLALIAQGRSNKQISEELTISEKTVKTHVSNILTKLHLEDRTQAAIYALKEGLVPFS